MSAILNDRAISELAVAGMIEGFVSECIRKHGDQRVISYGLQSFGYDIRISNQFQVFQVPLDHHGIVDPKNFEPRLLRSYTGDFCIIPPHSFALGSSVEYFRMPSNVTGILLGKSTLARCGIVVNFTPLEAGWEGNITIEISNTSGLPAKIYANEGIAQCLFFEGEEPSVTYASRAGKYQGQRGITLAKL